MAIGIVEVDGDVVEIDTPAGPVRLLGAVALEGRRLSVRRAHVEGLTANALGIGQIMRLAEQVMEDLDVDGLVIAGSSRTTGARPGHTPRPLRFTRKRPPEGQS